MKNKVIVITGAAKGLGKCLAKQLVEKGAIVVISDIDQETLREAADELEVTSFTANVSNEKEIIELAHNTVEEFGPIDIWINNAGVWLPKLPLEEIDTAQAHRLFEINIFGTFNGMKVALSHMKKAGKGTIVNISSTTAFDDNNGSSGSAYVASKYAIRGLTNSIRDEVKDTAISIIGVYPGGMKTELFDDHKPHAFDDFLSPESVAEKIIANLEKEKPETQLIIPRPGQQITSKQ